ncbi:MULTISPECIES: XisH family protein [unclassified Synechocystis]|uniref:XisH family protein n=1 Tax=unclassified Synechocystis TaxID=2640012 RepID=UPI0003FB75AA|nr:MULTISPECIES: XisH family protein [unclassified Synechocystis]MCT0254658.1 XisH family protein [Synechocystis sp. CS-94]
MPAKDIYHDTVKNALTKDGWVILADPYTVEYEGDNLYADLLAEKTSLPKRQERIIVVEIKSFISPSPMNDFQNALGQYLLYRDFLQFSHKDYQLYLAVKTSIFDTFFQRKSIQAVIKHHQVNFVTFNDKKEEITSWIKS